MLTVGKGHIVTVASLAGHLAALRLADYCASKHAAVGFTDALRLELRNDGYEDIHVTEISPYYIDTAMFRGVQSGYLSDVQQVDHVAEVAIRGILANEDRVYIPFIFAFVIALKA